MPYGKSLLKKIEHIGDIINSFGRGVSLNLGGFYFSFDPTNRVWSMDAHDAPVYYNGERYIKNIKTGDLYTIVKNISSFYDDYVSEHEY